jgi:flagellar hook assembly protein FlgD
VSLAIYGLRGERIRTLIDGERAAGAHSIVWDGRDDRGRAVGAGAYFYRLEGLGRSVSRRLVWMN